MKKLVLFSICILIGLSVHAGRMVQSFNDAWYFSPLNSDNYSESLQMHQWEPVHIPHTWNTDAYTQRNYRRESSWYKKEFRLDAGQINNKHIYLKFDAINSLADIYLNDKLLTTHKGGYSAFTVDITHNIKENQTNLLAIRVNNENNNIPPLSGDFTIFGGIYRDVWLITTEKQHFTTTNHASDGVFITLPKVNEKEANVAICGTISNYTKKNNPLQLHIQILDKDGEVVSQSKQKIKTGEDRETIFEASAQITNPRLWSPDSPYLYKVKLTLTDNQGKDIKDELTLPLGIRWFSVDTNQGFRLNGKPLKLMGVCRHQDQAPLGIALSDEMHRRDMKLIKEMGANFVRLAHYQHNDAVLEACDRLGLLVWEEIPVVDIISTSTDFSDNAKSALREMIRQHYNHPSVIMWGYMNEAVIQVQYKVKKEERDHVYKKTVALAGELEKLLKEEDSSRLSAMAYHGNQIYNEIGLAGISDISGWNLYQGWYENDFNAFDRFVDEENRKYPERPLIISEFGAGSDKRIQSLNPQVFDFSMQWQQLYLEHYLPTIMKRPFIIGASEWNFIDFSSASRQESTPRINNKGLVYADRTPKDVYYYFQSFLRKDIPVLHLAINDWKKRILISDSETTIQPIKVYTNLQEATLFVNGQKVETQNINNYNAVWQVSLKEGKNHLRATGMYNDKMIEKHAEIEIEFKPVRLTKDNTENLNIGINAGSNCFFIDDKSGFCWLPDKEYTVGSWGYIGGNVFKKNPSRIGTTSEIKGTYNTPLFQTKRENPDAYRFDVPNGMYELQLLFSDLYNAPPREAYDLAKQTNEKPIHNQFNIYINEKIENKDFSPFAERGNNSAINKTYIVKVEDNNITVRLERLKGNSFINALKIRKL
ncbi:glycoside hydrolase family 2 TIM barrel-domain containing protein [Bacteroides sp. 51]|uniref:glycoside hydrolase family 2 TIM barrel-domain containing protein n=1 Tax=Bacteroides sp. 51 TaxID=2302938 RepID=UPI0013D06D4C|nr:glycoside hydrolase family 2 TIM barrel-domain containing protein [Bacteroides sp. 51]NDV82085.1 DUF4982 domain-containing protein [Bacteroides sp. 51]